NRATSAAPISSRRRSPREPASMSHDALRAEICRVGASLYARGYVHASAGNISVRTDAGFLITPTDACLGTLDPARLAEVDARGAPIRAVMLERLGPVVWHASPAEASAVLEELEETARLWLMCKPMPLTPEQIDDLRTHFGARW